MYGYTGKLLEVDLGAGTTHEIALDPELARSYIGGSGLAARLYLDRLGAAALSRPARPGRAAVRDDRAGGRPPAAGHQPLRHLRPLAPERILGRGQLRRLLRARAEGGRV